MNYCCDYEIRRILCIFNSLNGNGERARFAVLKAVLQTALLAISPTVRGSSGVKTFKFGEFELLRGLLIFAGKLELRDADPVQLVAQTTRGSAWFCICLLLPQTMCRV